METLKKAKLDTAADGSVVVAWSKARSAIADLPDSKGEKIAITLIKSRRRLPDSLTLDAGRTVAHNDAGNRLRIGEGMKIAGSLSKRGKTAKRTRVAKCDEANTRTLETAQELRFRLVDLGREIVRHSPDGEHPSGRKRKRAQHRALGVRGLLADMGLLP